MYKLYLLLLLLLLVTFAGFSRSNSDDNASKKTIIQIEGLVEVGSKNRISIKTNWQSRSSVSYTVVGALTKELETHLGKVVVAEGYVTKDNSPWVKEFNLVSIIEIKDKE